MPKEQYRILGLDHWRVLMLVLGVFLHGAQADHWSKWVIVATHSFRMEAFYFISGILSAASLNRPSIAGWVSKRTCQLGIPILFSAITLNVFVVMSNDYLHGNLIFSPYSFVSLPTLHMWFAILLLVYSVIHATIIERKIYCLPFLVFFTNRITRNSQSILIFSFTALIFSHVCSMFFVNIFDPNNSIFVYGKVSHRITALMHDTFAVAPYFAVYFIFGVTIYHKPELSRTIFHARFVIFILALASIVSMILLSLNFSTAVISSVDMNINTLASLILSGTRLITAPISCALIIISMRYSKKNVAFFEKANSAGLTVYVIHNAVIYLICVSWTLSGRSGCPPYLTLCIIATSLSFAFHFLVVNRYPIFALLINGKLDVSKIKSNLPSAWRRCRSEG